MRIITAVERRRPIVTGAVTLALATAARFAGGASAATAPAPPAFHAELRTEPDTLRADAPASLGFTVRDARGEAVRFLQFVHERPLHLIVVSRDLAEFAHIHPELGVDDAYHVTHTFAHGGGYRLFADYTPPGSGTRVDRFDVNVAGPARQPAPLVADRVLAHAVDGVRVTLTPSAPLVARADLMLELAFADADSGRPITDLQLYLGALAHVIIVSQDLADFIHAHPLETGEVYDPSLDPATVHVHDPALLAKVLKGPSPPVIRAATSFPRAGLYKLWVQFQRHDRVSTVPFVVRVGAAPASTPAAAVVPAAAIPIVVDASGYTPARVELKRGIPAVLAFTRPDAGNCAGTLVIQGLGIRRELPIGQTVLVPIAAAEAGEIPFACGMGMYHGLIVVR